MKKRLAPIVLAVPLLIAGCGAAEPEPTPEEIFLSEMEAAFDPPEGVEANSDLTEISEGGTFHLDCYSHLPCDGDFTIETITMSDECAQRVEDYGLGPELEEGQTYLQVDGIFELHTAANGWTMLDDPQVINADGFTENVKMAINCHEDGEYQLWSSTLDAGQKAKHFGVWIVPEGATHALIEDVKITLPKVDDKPEVVLPDAWGNMPTTSAPAPEPVPAASAPTIVECLEGTPGPTLMSDGTMQYTDYCFNLLGGPAYLEQESQSGCPAAVCGYGTNSQGQKNPSSGEIQTLHGCQDGYINDPELCGAVAWVENHQY